MSDIEPKSDVLTLYTGANCHLCEQARQLIYGVIAGTGWRLREVEIDTDEALFQRYRILIPVLVSPAGTEKGWPFSPGLVRRLLAESNGVP